MRSGLAGLTGRGRAFVGGGLATIVAAALIGQTSIVRLGVLAIVLALLAAWWVGRSRQRLALTRTVSPQQVQVGKPAIVNLTLANDASRSTGTLLLEERLPYVLGTRPRFILEGMGAGWRRHVTYQVRSDLRGKYDIGPMTVRVVDPFGLVELGRTFHASATLTVTPKVLPLPSTGLGGAWTGSGDNRPRSFASGSAEDVTVREYRRGDDLRRVHWRSSARVGELMVRREEQPWQSRATVFLDNRLSAHRGQGAASSLETAVTVAASVAVHLTQRGYSVRLMTSSGEDHDTQWHSRSSAASTAPLLEALAVVGADHRPMPDTHWLADSGGGGLVVGVFGHLTAADAGFLRRLRHHSSTCMAIALDVDQWAPHAPPLADLDAGSQLTLAGWHSAPLGPRDSLQVAWQQLGSMTSRAVEGARA